MHPELTQSPSPTDHIPGYDLLDSLKDQIDNNNEFISIDGELEFTKTPQGHVSAILFRDHELEKDTKDWIIERLGSLENGLARYADYDDRFTSTTFPAHYPTTIVKGSDHLGQGENIFAVFPLCLKQKARNSKDHIGFEFIDVWSHVFDEIVFPCLERLADQETIASIKPLKENFHKTVYLASLFHELGHKVGPFRINETPEIHLPKFMMNAVCELSTDSLMIKMFPEFPELKQFVVLQRILWFSRRGITNNEVSAKLNQEGDNIVGTIFWNRLKDAGALIFKTNKIHIDWELVIPVLTKLSADLDILGNKLISEPQIEHARLTQTWLSNEIKYDDSNGFLLPDEAIKCFRACVDIPEVPKNQC